MLSYCAEFFSTLGAELATLAILGRVMDARPLHSTSRSAVGGGIGNLCGGTRCGKRKFLIGSRGCGNDPAAVASLASSLDALAEAARKLDRPDPEGISTTTDEMDVLPGPGLFYVALSMAVLKKL